MNLRLQEYVLYCLYKLLLALNNVIDKKIVVS